MEGFITIFNDLKRDLRITFPELNERLNDLSECDVYNHCLSTFPSYFFDILYEKDSLFDSEQYLLPGIDFSILMKDPKISDKSRQTLWKYLQLILFYSVEKTNSLEDRDELHTKMEKTMEDMKEMFKESDISNTFQNMFKDISTNETDDIKEKLDSMMNGKIGSIAKEIADETSKEFGNPEDFMKTIMNDPSKIMGLVQNIGSKLESKLKSNDLKDSDMMDEASNIMKQMNAIPGLQEMISKMGKMDMKGMMNKMEQNKKKSDAKDRMRDKLDKKNKPVQNVMGEQTIQQKDDGNYVFRKGTPPKQSNRKKKKHNKKE